MAKKLRIVNDSGQIMIYQGKPLVFDLDNPKVTVESNGISERERAEGILWLLRRGAANGPFRLEEFEEAS